MTFFVATKPILRYASIHLVAKAFVEAFKELGFDKTEYREVGEALRKELTPDDLLFQIPIGLEWQPPCKTIVYNYDLLPWFPEPGPGPIKYWELVQKDLAYGASVFDYDPFNVSFLQKHGASAFFCPIGYSQIYEVPNNTEPLRPGTYFLGSLTMTRRKILKRVKVSRINTQKDFSLKARLLCTEGVHLCLRSVAQMMPFDCLRVMLFLSNRRCVLSEPPDWSPLRDGIHWETAPINEMRALITRLRKNPKRQQERGNAGYGFITGAFRQEQLLEKALQGYFAA